MGVILFVQGSKMSAFLKLDVNIPDYFSFYLLYSFNIFFKIILAILLMIQPEVNQSLDFMPDMRFGKNSTCNCLPSCTYNIYRTEFNQGKLSLNNSSFGKQML